jgi:hypothetical protein
MHSNLGSPSQSASAATSLRGFVMNPVVPAGSLGGQSPSPSLNANLPVAVLREGPMGGFTHAGKRDSIAMLDDVGGEWEREGLGRGLEERLEIMVGGSGKIST